MHGQPSHLKTWADLARELAARAGQPEVAATFPKAKGTFITFDIPGARFLQLEGINPRGEIVGAYYDSSFNLQNFVVSDSTFRNIDPPGAGFQFLFLMTQIGINPQGDIVGLTIATGGFLLSRGTVTSIDVPGSSATAPYGIDPQGDIVGTYVDSNNNFHGFVLRK